MPPRETLRLLLSNRTKSFATPPNSHIRELSSGAHEQKTRANNGASPEFSAVEPTDCRRSSGFQHTELHERGNAVVETDLFDDSAILKTQHSRAAEAHLATRCRRKRPDKEVAEGRASMRTATFPSTDDTVAFSDKVRGAPEIKVREGRTEISS